MARLYALIFQTLTEDSVANQPSDSDISTCISKTRTLSAHFIHEFLSYVTALTAHFENYYFMSCINSQGTREQHVHILRWLDCGLAVNVILSDNGARVDRVTTLSCYCASTSNHMDDETAEIELVRLSSASKTAP